MLAQLSIKNFGLIDEIQIDFSSDLNILTGETGAGKSILLDALRFVLGERVNTTQIRDGSLPCSVEVIFELQKHPELVKNEQIKEYLDESTLIINRIYTPDGRNKIKINGVSMMVSQLKIIGDSLVDFHGPHDHQMLLNDEMHLSILDRLATFEDHRGQYTKSFQEYSKIKRQIDELDSLKQSRERELDMLTHQVKELGEVALDEDVYNELKQSQAKINNTERLFEEVNKIIQILDTDTTGVGDQVRNCFGPMQSLNQVDEGTVEFGALLDQLQANSDDLSSSLKDYAQSLSFEPQEATEIHTKCDLYEGILRKYGPTLIDAQEFYTKAKMQYDLLANLEQNDAHLHTQLSKVEAELSKQAAEMTKSRKKAATNLKETIEIELTELGIKHVEFEVKIEKSQYTEDGIDQVTFYISPNVGEELKPLAQIVSSGEAARVMLALKRALTKVDPIPVLIFDEIDAQIGGRLGTIIGRKLKEISSYRQVILITHLPQIASFADNHYMVTKFVEKGRSITSVKCLDSNERVEELAKMMSGDDKTAVSINHAQDLLVKAAER